MRSALLTASRTGPLNILHTFKHHLVLVGPARSVNDKDHHINVLQGAAGGLVHETIQGFLIVLVQAGGIHIDGLNIALGLDAEHVMPGGLRLARSNGQFLPQNMVEQRGLADVGADPTMAT